MVRLTVFEWKFSVVTKACTTPILLCKALMNIDRLSPVHINQYANMSSSTVSLSMRMSIRCNRFTAIVLSNDSAKMFCLKSPSKW